MKILGSQTLAPEGEPVKLTKDLEDRALRRKKEVKDLMRSVQASRSSQVELSFLLQDWTDGYNVGGLLRVADALGCTKIYTTGKTPGLGNPTVGVTSMGAHRRVEIERHERHEDAALAAKAEGWDLLAVEISRQAVIYTSHEYRGRICLCLGSEGAGLYPAILKHCSASVFVPMAGKGRSLNVHVSGAVVAFHALWGSEKTSGGQKSISEMTEDAV